MRLLLDTHALVWAKSAPGSMTEEARAAIVDADNDVFVSLASAWELCIKSMVGKLRGNVSALIGSAATFRSQLEASGFELLPIEPPHVFETLRLPLHHRDPFDRMLAAQARVEDLVIVTRDQAFAPYGVRLLQT